MSDISELQGRIEELEHELRQAKAQAQNYKNEAAELIKILANAAAQLQQQTPALHRELEEVIRASKGLDE
jgi:predicted  nucleic acid-binding Zn-ribbon protein